MLYFEERGNYEERQKVEGGHSEQVIPAQINKLEINGNSNDKDFNKQTDNNITENNAIKDVHNNNKALNESKITGSTGSKTGEKEESNSKETTSTNEIEKKKDTTTKTNKEQLDKTKDTGNGKKYFKTGHRHRLKVQEKFRKRKH